MNPITEHRNRTIRTDLTQLIENALEETFLTADAAASASTITVSNINGLSTSQFLWVNPFSETSEILTTHASTAPSGTTVTLASASVFAHSAGEKVYRVEFNQVEMSHASTLTGSKSVLATESIGGDQKEHIYLDTTQTSGYYFVRFKNSVAATFSGYSDGVVYGGFTANSVGYMIDRALSDLSETLSIKISTRDCYEWINQGIRLIQGKLKRWPEHFAYNAVLGQVSRGTNVLALPTDAYDTETNKSIIAFRIGTGKGLHYLSPGEFDAQLDTVAVTQVTTQASAAATTLAIDNSYDFDDSGSVHVYISGTQYTITYTGVTRSATAGVLTGIPASGTGSITVTIPVDTYVWQNETEGTPRYFTIRNGNFEWFPLADASHDNTNAYGDYAKVATSVDSEGDSIDLQRYDMLQAYLTWRMKMKTRNNGTLDENDGWFQMFRTILNDAIRTLGNPNKYPLRPKVNRMSRRGAPMTPDIQDLNVNDQ